MQHNILPSLLAGLAIVTAAPVTAAAQDAVVDSVTSTPVSFLPVHVGGKVKADQRGYSYQWPGVYFEARFKGQTVTALFDDDANNFNVIVDGKPYALVQRPGKTSLSVSLQVAGEHTVRLEKRSETQDATGHFIGFIGTPDGDTPVPARQIEFIGDSLTVGYGNTSAFKDCTAEEIFETTNAQQGFPALVGKHYKADYQINAFSGLGMVRNYDGREHPQYHMPMLYDRALFDDPTPALQPGWHPQIIVIGIGGNDFSTDLHAGEPWKDEAALKADYEKTYIAFVQHVRAENPGAFILLTSIDEHPDYTSGTTDVFMALKAHGMTRIDRLFLPQLDRTSCNSHPNVRDDARIASMFEDYFDAHPDLWQGR